MSILSFFKRSPPTDKEAKFRAYATYFHSNPTKESIMTKPTFTFNSKETYLAYRAEWKQRYLDQIKAVRAAKQGIKDANRAYSKHSKTISDIWTAYRDLRKAHEETKKLLTERWAASAEAGRQTREKQAA